MILRWSCHARVSSLSKLDTVLHDLTARPNEDIIKCIIHFSSSNAIENREGERQREPEFRRIYCVYAYEKHNVCKLVWMDVCIRYEDPSRNNSSTIQLSNNRMSLSNYMGLAWRKKTVYTRKWIQEQTNITKKYLRRCKLTLSLAFYKNRTLQSSLLRRKSSFAFKIHTKSRMFWKILFFKGVHWWIGRIEDLPSIYRKKTASFKKLLLVFFNSFSVNVGIPNHLRSKMRHFRYHEQILWAFTGNFVF